MPNTATVRVRGLAELQRDLNKVNRGAAKTVRDALKEAAEPVRDDATQLAVSQIRKVGPVWSQFRVGTRPGSVYVAPKARNRGGSRRPRFGQLLLERAMWPALDKNEGEIERRVEDALDGLTRSAGFY